MRICDLNTLYLDGGTGGVNTYLHEKARFLAGLDGVEHHIVVPAAASGRRRLFRSTVHAIRSPRIPGSPHRVLARLGAVRRILREAAPDIVEADSTYFLGRAAAGAVRGRATVIGFHHSHLPSLAAWRTPGGSFPAKLLEALAWRYLEFCARPLARLVVSSLDVRRRLEARGVGRLAHVPLGVNLDLFRPGDPAPGPVRTVLFVGRLSEEKELGLLFDAFALLAGRRDDLRLSVVGDGPLRSTVEGIARRRPDVGYGGPCPYGPDLARLYAAADIFVMPGRNETFGLAALEALASGLPVAAVARGGPLDIITPEVGALARPGDAADLADRIDGLLRRRPPAEACRRRAEACSWSRTFRRLLEVYDEARRGGPPGRGRVDPIPAGHPPERLPAGRTPEESLGSARP